MGEEGERGREREGERESQLCVAILSLLTRLHGRAEGLGFRHATGKGFFSGT